MTTFDYRYFRPNELVTYMSDSECKELFTKNVIFDLLRLVGIVDDFRDWACQSVRLTSTYRNAAHNAKEGGSPTSQHMLGQAVDFQLVKDKEYTASFFKNFLTKYRVSYEHRLGQVILYPTKVHIALPNLKHPKLEILDKRF